MNRVIEDSVTTLAASLDTAVRRIETAYEVRGMPIRVSSFDSPTVGSGGIVNEVQFQYNDFGQSILTSQAHSGAVIPGTTPSVRMGYADGAANTIRPMSLTYPNGRVVTYDYGKSGGIQDSTSRVAGLIDGDLSATHLADYSYLGLGAVVQQVSTQPGLRFTLVNPTGGNDPVTGDIYSGLDLFGRVKDVRWRNATTGDDLSRMRWSRPGANTNDRGKMIWCHRSGAD